MDAIKEKSKDLFNTFFPYCTHNTEGVVSPNAKECAIILCEEIINLPMAYHTTYDKDYSVGEFYEEVIKKIKTL